MKKFVQIILILSAGLLASAQDIPLPAPQKTVGMPLMEALNARQTGRDFSSKPLSDQQLADLLWAAFGINRPDGKRTAPSARNMQEIDLYVAMPSGLYFYNAQKNILEKILTKIFARRPASSPSRGGPRLI